MEPLQNIFNHSISIGEFPSVWKEAIITPVHKKGDKSELINYRPVSCLPAAAKLLELVVSKQTTQYMEENKLLPSSHWVFHSLCFNHPSLNFMHSVKYIDCSELVDYTGNLTVLRGKTARFFTYQSMPLV